MCYEYEQNLSNYLTYLVLLTMWRVPPRSGPYFGRVHLFILKCKKGGKRMHRE